MSRALVLIRSLPHYRRDAFERGLQAVGLKLTSAVHDPGPGDVLVIWNRYGSMQSTADRFERGGARVIVVENCPLGNGFRPGRWYSLAGNHVAMTGGTIAPAAADRWDSWGVPLAPWRRGAGAPMVLAQRGIGEPGIASPLRWSEKMQRRTGGVLRMHPGTGPCEPLQAAIERVDPCAVVTWSSAAAVQALALGVPVWHHHPDFVMAACSLPFSRYGEPPLCDEGLRLQAFRRLAGAIWEVDEIARGDAIKGLL